MFGSAIRARLRAAAAIALLAVGASSCEDFSPPLTSRFDAGNAGRRCIDDDTNPDNAVQFERDILQGIFLRRRPQGPGCGCHQPTGNDPIGFTLTGLDLSSYRGMRRGGARSGEAVVVPGRPCDSVLYQKLTQTPPFGTRMPRNGPPFLSEGEIALIHDWIAEGAIEN